MCLRLWVEKYVRHSFTCRNKIEKRSKKYSEADTSNIYLLSISA